MKPDADKATVHAWGDNSNGLLGNGAVPDKSPHPTPAAIANLNLLKPDNVPGGGSYYVPQVTTFGIRPSTVSCMFSAAAAVDGFGYVWTWGKNYYGQLGDGTTLDHFTPARVYADTNHNLFTGVVSISVGAYRMVALKADGTVWAWGYGGRGALGDGSTGSHFHVYPQEVLVDSGDPSVPGSPLRDIVQVVCGGTGFSLALTKEGTVYGWGENGSFQLGLDNNTDQSKAVLIQGLSGVRRIAAGSYHSLALSPSEGGKVYAWGGNTYGQCGLGFYSKYQTVPRLMEGDNFAFTDIAAGSYFSLMIRGSALPVPQVWATGDNQYGQLATGTSKNQYQVPTMTHY